jgi:hypothetical protein
MKNYIVQTGATLTGALNDGVLTIGGTAGGDVKLLWTNIKKAEYVAYGAGTAQVSTVTVSGTLTAGNVISLQLSQDMSKGNLVGPREKVCIITHVINATDTVTSVAQSIVAQVNNHVLEVVASNASGVVTLTATLPYAIFSVNEVQDPGANVAITLTGGSNVTGVKPSGFTGAELVASEIVNASASANYGIFRFIYSFPKNDDKIVAETSEVVNLYVASTVSATDLLNSLKALDIEDIGATVNQAAVNAILAQIREYLAKLS